MKIKVDGLDLTETEYSSKRILLDTNLLVYAYNKSSPQHHNASCILIASVQGNLNAHVSHQNLLEFYSVMTNPRKITPTPKPNEIQGICTDLLKSSRLKKIGTGAKNYVLETIGIAANIGVRGSQIFDCLLAVTAKQNRIELIWTENIRDFEPLQDLVNVENPLLRNWEILDVQ